jgi:hypothetical protein
MIHEQRFLAQRGAFTRWSTPWRPFPTLVPPLDFLQMMELFSLRRRRSPPRWEGHRECDRKLARKPAKATVHVFYNFSAICLQLLDTHAVGVRREKMYRIDNHIACSVAGITGTFGLCSRIRAFWSSDIFLKCKVRIELQYLFLFHLPQRTQTSW